MNKQAIPVFYNKDKSGKNIFFMMVFSWHVCWRQIVLVHHLILLVHNNTECHGEAENRVLNRVGGKKSNNMKKIIFVIMLNAVCFFSFCQGYDDGLVSSHLSVNTSETKYTSFVNEFRKGIDNVKNEIITSADGIATYYGVDVRDYTKFDQVVANANLGNTNEYFSTNYLNQVKSVLDKLDNQYDNIGQFRNDLVGIATSSSLSENESEFLALLDITTQEISTSLLNLSLSGQTAFVLNNNNEKDNTDINFLESYKDSSLIFSVTTIKKIPHWVRCALGVFGSAILGGLQGGGSGFTMGGLVGAAVGGIAGVMGGTFIGAATFC